MKGFSNSLTMFAWLLFAVAIAASGCTSSTRISYEPSSIKTGRVININSADASTLQTLPGIGRELAVRIVEHRTHYGPFRKPEHLLIVDGISEKRFYEVQELITTD